MKMALRMVAGDVLETGEVVKVVLARPGQWWVFMATDSRQITVQYDEFVPVVVPA